MNQYIMYTVWGTGKDLDSQHFWTLMAQFLGDVFMYTLYKISPLAFIKNIIFILFKLHSEKDSSVMLSTAGSSWLRVC